MPPKVLRLFPGPSAELAAEDVYSDLKFPAARLAADGDPYVAINMVSTLDGKASIGGKASPIGSPVDREIMRSLRSSFDAVLVGANTVRAEEMNLTVPQSLASKRKARGQREQPLGVVLAGAGSLPLERKLFRSQDFLPIILHGASTPEKTIQQASKIGIEVLGTQTDGPPSPREALKLLEERYGVRSALLEGGPSTNRAFLSAGVLDELFITLSPKLSRDPGEAPTIIAPHGHPGSGLDDLELRSVHASPQHGELYLRYRFPRHSQEA